MAPTLEEKRKMQITRKKLMRKEERKVKQRTENAKEIEATVAALSEETSRQRQLARKYYTVWKECPIQKDTSKQLEKNETVSLNLHTFTAFQYSKAWRCHNIKACH